MSDFNVPVGTIATYCGPVTTDEEKQALSALGWLPCDGTSYNKAQYAQLALAIGISYGGTGGSRGSFNVPDLRGRFLRGTAHGSPVDPNAASRIAINPGGATGDSVGSLQAYATALSRNPFQAATAGRHQHSLPHGPNNNNAYAIAGSHYGIWNTGAVQTDDAGSHNHTLSGGWDAESRPNNVYANFIIKYQDQDS
ncbi:MAG TPA: phage tail protein [Acetobacteraceae bacterium]|jgi:hypothetical protein